ncbi:hypothetical protein EVA_21284, partial [gut metagenome]
IELLNKTKFHKFLISFKQECGIIKVTKV